VKRFGLIGVIFFMVLLSSTVVFAGDRDFVLDNHTGYEIIEVYVSSSGSDDWGNDVLGSNTLRNNYHVPITFRNNRGSTYFDIMVVFDGGSNKSWSHFNLREIGTITLNRNGTASHD